jgi:NADPH:quinone reductase-like Zn-dependent oxidoreductase
VTEVRSIPIRKLGPASVLAVETATTTIERGPRDVAIDVRYSGVSFADVHMRLGPYPAAPPRPYVPGLELGGVVTAVGAEVKHLAAGDEVVAGSTSLGAYAVNFVTCHIALFEMGRVRAGDRVLIEGASGGIGNIAVQLARHAGASVVGLTTSTAKKPFIAAMGATPYTESEFYASWVVGWRRDRYRLRSNPIRAIMGRASAARRHGRVLRPASTSGSAVHA